ncbi:MAG: type II toxin-antitoxin system RelE/ParE family toxin [bacterium]
MASHRIHREAARDLLDIGRYTQRRWGVAQRRRYLGDLEERMRFLAENPHSGAPRGDIREGLRSFLQGGHVIFYLEGAEGVDIVRILHHSMDVLRHFPPEGEVEDE